MGTVNLKTASGGSVILSPANTASDVTITVPAANATMAVNGPAFSAYQSTLQSSSNNVFVQIAFQTKVFDTASCFNNTNATVGGIPAYSFLPNVAGYYQVNTGVQVLNTSGIAVVTIYKNGISTFSGNFSNASTSTTLSIASALIYLNGSTDYISSYVYQNSGAAANTSAESKTTYFQAAMVRSA